MSKEILDRLNTLRKQESEGRSNLDRAKGRLELLMKQLTDEYGCSSFKEGKEKLDELNKDISRRTERFEKLLSETEADVNG